MPSTLYSSLLLISNLKSSCVSFTYLFLWYFILIEIYKKHCEFSICWAIWAYKLVCPLGITLKKNQKTWLIVCNSALFLSACYSAGPYCLGYSFEAWLFYYKFVSEAFVCGQDSIDKQLSALRAWRKSLLQFLILSED